ncbi:MAG: hypothetical protein K8823_1049 [Cenarchaeum symbiont of Oopsacas minuta]|nr:hypothetical protein [Cenarchaeum symbiont of Oopsacas minuta]
MVIDPEYKKRTNDLVVQSLELYKSAGASQRISDVWHAQREGDFLCGFFVGEMIGSALSAFQTFHGREPTTQEHGEIVDIIEVHATQIRDFFSKFNPN